MSHLKFTDDNFKREVLSSAVPVVVDVWAPWCGPCQALGPVIEDLAEEFDGRVKVGKLNSDENIAVPTSLRVSAIPTVLFFKGGRLVDRAIGLTPKAALRRQIERLLGDG
ncbi:MAG: thioredoxin [Elusimicrobia bacterium]|nr:thioredoxin [Elusimicrobiota bacterium]